MRDHSIPVVRLEVEYMKHAIIHAFSEHTLKVDASVKQAVEEFCTPKNIDSIVAKAVNDALEYVIKDEIERFFRYGAGQAAVREAVLKRLERDAENGKRYG